MKTALFEPSSCACRLPIYPVIDPRLCFKEETMADFLLERELPNLKVAVDNSLLETDNDESMVLDETTAKADDTAGLPAAALDRNEKGREVAAEETQDLEDDSTWEDRIQELYRSLKVDAKRPAGTKLNTLHVRGVSDMSTDDIMNYFKDYGPSSVNWINKYACNVVWELEGDAARALLSLSRPLLLSRSAKPETSGKSPLDRPSKAQVSSNGEEVVLMSEEEEDTLEEGCQPAERLDVSQLEMPLPPGQWRRGVGPHPKAKLLLLRFSSKHDKSVSDPGIEVQNPRMAGKTNLEGEPRGGVKRKSSQMRMKMYADEEEENVRQKKKKRAVLGRAPTPWSTPGNSEEEDTVRPPPSSSSVWDRLSGGRAALFVERAPMPRVSLPTHRSTYMDLDDPPLRRSSYMDLDNPPPLRRSGYVDLDDPSLREDYDPSEDGYDDGYSYRTSRSWVGRSGPRQQSPGDLEGAGGNYEEGPRLSSTVKMAGVDLRSKLEKLRRSRTDRVNPLRISVSSDAV